MAIAEFQEDYFAYLNELQASGVTNMLGAASYLEDKFWIEVDIIYLEVAPIAPPIAIDRIKYILLALFNYH